jgi:2-dehydropantoate 2-reductase
MRIAVFGAGSVGGYFGAKLAQAGEEVIFIARGDHLRAIQSHGLKIESLQGDSHLPSVMATENPAMVGTMDVILVGVKAWQVTEAATAMRSMVGEKTLVVPLQNGIEATHDLIAVLGAESVIRGLCRISSRIIAPGVIQHSGIDPLIAFGELNNQVSQRVKGLQDAFIKAGVNAQIPEDIHAAMWDKFMFISAFGGVGAITRQPAGVIRGLPGTRHLLHLTMDEILAVAWAYNIELDDQAVSRNLALIDRLSATAMTSMQRDILEGRPSELSWQNGAAVRWGKDKGVPTPINSFIYNSLLPQELQARQEL